MMKISVQIPNKPFHFLLGCLFIFKVGSAQINLLTTGNIANSGYDPGIVCSNTFRQAELLHSFPSLDPISPAALVTGNDGKIYGLTIKGGENGAGVLYTVNNDGTGFKSLYHFSISDTLDNRLLLFGPDNKLYFIKSFSVLCSINTDGTDLKAIVRLPYNVSFRQAMLMDNEGWIYALANYADANFNVIKSLYKIKFDGTGYTELHRFTSTDGDPDVLNICITPTNRIYGVNNSGTYSGVKALFSLGKDGSNFTIHYKFDSTEIGAYIPQEGFLQHKNGKLFFTTLFYGANGLGSILSFDTTTKEISSLYQFTNSAPRSNLVMDGSKFYGINDLGMFSINQDGTNFQQVSSASVGTALQYSSITNSLIYLSLNGFYLNEFIAKINTATFQMTDLHSFGYNPGGYEPEGLVRAANGTIFGITKKGGQQCGTLFKLNAFGEGYQKIYDFVGNNGMMPSGNILCIANKIYGLCTKSGTNGINNNYLIYSVDTSGLNYQVLKVFDRFSEGNPTIGLAYDGSGFLYGVSDFVDDAKVFKIKTDGSSFSVIKAFSNSGDEGRWPVEGIVYREGYIYGEMKYGGVNNGGLLYRINTNGGGFSVLHHFTSSPYNKPIRGLLLASDNKIYGCTESNGNGGYGEVFSFDPTTLEYKVIYTINQSFLINVTSRLYEASDGKLYFNVGSSTVCTEKNGNNPLVVKTGYLASVFNNSLLEISNRNSFCESDTARIVSNITGNSYLYQWQVNTGAGFIDLLNNANYSGVTAPTLQLISLNASMNGYKYRCVVDTGAGSVYSIEVTSQVKNAWLGTSDTNWNNAGNWSCGKVPTSTTAVFIPIGLVNYPVISTTVTCKTLEVQPGANVTVASGGNIVLTGN